MKLKYTEATKKNGAAIALKEYVIYLFHKVIFQLVQLKQRERGKKGV